LSPDSRDFEYCNDPSSRQSQKIMRQRAEYERRRSELHANPSSPVKPPRPPASSSHDSAATPAHDQVFHDADPVFFNSPEVREIILATLLLLADAAARVNCILYSCAVGFRPFFFGLLYLFCSTPIEFKTTNSTMCHEHPLSPRYCALDQAPHHDHYFSL